MEAKNEVIFLHTLWIHEYERLGDDAPKDYLEAIKNSVQRLYNTYGHQCEESTVEILEPVEQEAGGTVYSFRVIPPESKRLRELKLAFVL